MNRAEPYSLAVALSSLDNVRSLPPKFHDYVRDSFSSFKSGLRDSSYQPPQSCELCFCRFRLAKSWADVVKAYDEIKLPADRNQGDDDQMHDWTRLPSRMSQPHVSIPIPTNPLELVTLQDEIDTVIVAAVTEFNEVEKLNFKDLAQIVSRDLSAKAGIDFLIRAIVMYQSGMSIQSCRALAENTFTLLEGIETQSSGLLASTDGDTTASETRTT